MTNIRKARPAIVFKSRKKAPARICYRMLESYDVCVIIPTYNNAGTIVQVVDEVSQYVQFIIVVNDGSTDDTAKLLKGKKVSLINLPQNFGKGSALRYGFREALAVGYSYAITFDADGQHRPADLYTMMRMLPVDRPTLIVGCRDLTAPNMPTRNTAANRFSNFWVKFLTWYDLPDTQCGLRLYTLKHLEQLQWLPSRYEAELALLVRAAWLGEKILHTKVEVYYPPKGERVSHFRPIKDFLRISLLNTVLCVVAICYGWWVRLYHLLVAKL